MQLLKCVIVILMFLGVFIFYDLPDDVHASATNDFAYANNEMFPPLPKAVDRTYSRQALKLVVHEANQFAEALKLQEDLPICESKHIRQIFKPA